MSKRTGSELTIADGFYRLTRDVENPEADRREKHNWTARPLWRAGSVFCVRDRMDYRAIELVGHRWTHQSTTTWCAKGQALIPALERIEEDYACVMHRLDMSGNTLLEKLHEMGKVSLGDLDAAFRQLQLDYTIEAHKNGEHAKRTWKDCPYCQQASKELADVIANLSNDED